ncbi:class I SAM-dependent methyltransferase [Candidatus Woesearchaeota archaeon]|nr:class I SAM-dependent methyltransferase [Candidatus Woesearchaeota archaeon]MBW3014346.1 class I SAM-dependent methyltransferase [Candidatus Woesearchaeota archaeon]
MTYYDEIASGYNELHSEEQKKKMQIINGILERWHAKPEQILDVGCGTGLSTPKGAFGADPSEELLKQHPGYPSKTVKADAEDLPFDDKQFDVVISVTAIHNFHDVEQGLKEIKRVGRRFILSILKKSNKFDEIKRLITHFFDVEQEIEEDKDIIFVCS